MYPTIFLLVVLRVNPIMFRFPVFLLLPKSIKTYFVPSQLYPTIYKKEVSMYGPGYVFLLAMERSVTGSESK
jgi:hypothetical protein